MFMIDLFDKQQVEFTIERIQKLKHNSMPLWGSMFAPQMLAHCNVAYDFVFEPERFERPGILKRFLLQLFVKKIVVGDKPYPRNSRTAPDFIIKDFRDFEQERDLLIHNLNRVQNLGKEYFDGKENHSFGKLTAKEWNTLFAKHLDHHLQQFGV